MYRFTVSVEQKKTRRSARNTSGGTAMYHGANYQARIAALFGCLALAENTNRLPPEVPKIGPPIRVGLEQSRPVDDIAVWLGPRALALVQAKASLDATGLGDVLEQMVRNVTHGREINPGTPLMADDRLILAVGHASDWIKDDLRTLLHRIGTLVDEDSIDQALQGDGPVRAAYEKVAPHARSALRISGLPHDDSAVRNVLRYARIWPISDDEIERMALGLLDPYVVENPDHAGTAFAVLCQHFAKAAQDRTAHTMQQIRTVLIEAGIALKAPPSVAADVLLLEERTEKTIALERARRTLVASDAEVHVQRAVTNDVVREISVGNVVLTGEAGAGKSDVLLASAQRLRDAGARVVFFDATDPGMRDPRLALALQHQIDIILERWNDAHSPSYLFIDGFDMTRMGESYDVLLHLLRQVQHTAVNWRVAIAAREYDLSYSPEVRDLFPARPDADTASLRDERFKSVSHIVVRRLSDEEFDLIGERSGVLKNLLDAAPQHVKELLRNPFNLAVAARLTLNQDGPPDLSSIRTHIDLLDLWWERRVRRGTTGLEKERLARDVSAAMLEARKLRLDIEALPGGDASNDVLSEGVLVTLGSRQRQISFAHAIIFDYVVDRTILDSPGALSQLLAKNRDVFLFALPSIRMRLAEIWKESPARFYAEVSGIFARPDQRRMMLLILARVIAENLEDSTDLLPLVESQDEASAAAIRLVTRVLIHEPDPLRNLAGGSPWPSVALALSHRVAYSHDTLLLIQQMLKATSSTSAARDTLAEAARNVLGHQIHAERYDAVLIRMAIEAFLRMYDAAPDAARPLLDLMLDRARIAQYGKFEIEPIASYARHVHDSEALAAIYEAVFSDIAFASETIPIGRPSAVFGLVQDAKQTLWHARWELAQRFPAFLDEHPEEAVRAFLLIIRRHAVSTGHTRDLEWSFEDSKMHVVQDASNIWDSDTYEHEPWRMMSKAFEARLQNTAYAGDGFFATALGATVAQRTPLYVWRILLRNAGLDEGASVAIAPLLFQRAPFMMHEIGEPIADFLKQGYPRLAEDAQSRIDSAILAVVDEEADAKVMKYREERVQEFAASIPRDLIRGPRLREIADRLATEASSAEDVAYNRRLTLSGSVSSGAFVSRVRLREWLSPNTPAEILEAVDAAEPFLDQATAASSDAAALAPLVRRVNEQSARQNDEVRHRALDIIAALVRIGLEREAFSLEERSEFLPLIIEGVSSSEDDGEPNAEEPDRHISWGTPNRVADGIQALWRLYAAGHHDSEIMRSLHALAGHKESGMRFLSVREAGRFRDQDADLVWRIAETALEDSVIGVVTAGLEAAGMVSHLDFDRLRRMMFRAYDRFAVAYPKDDSVRSFIRWTIARLTMNDKEAQSRLNPVIEAPWVHADLTESVVFLLASYLRPGSDSPDEAQTLGLLMRLTQNAVDHFFTLVTQYGKNAEEYPDGAAKELRSCINVLNEVAQRIYFGSGVMERATPTGHFEDTGVLSGERFEMLKPLLRSLATLPFSRTAYHVIKTLRGAIQSAPQETLLIAAEALNNGAKGGLAYDGMAEDDIRGFLVEYVANHRGLLEAQGDSLKSVMDIIDMFVDAGWPQWIDIVFDLDRIYRDG